MQGVSSSWFVLSFNGYTTQDAVISESLLYRRFLPILHNAKVSYIDKTMAAECVDELPIPGARASTTMVVTYMT